MPKIGRLRLTSAPQSLNLMRDYRGPRPHAAHGKKSSNNGGANGIEDRRRPTRTASHPSGYVQNGKGFHGNRRPTGIYGNVPQGIQSQRVEMIEAVVFEGLS
jgi:hypothetical protein